MGMLDNLEDKGKDMMDNPETRAKIEKMAKEKGMTMEEAKAHFMKHGDTTEQNQ